MNSEEPIVIHKEDLEKIPRPEISGADRASAIIITTSDVEPAFKISIEDVTAPVTIIEPKDGFESQRDCIDIVGMASPGARLQLILNETPGAVVTADNQGRFRFHQVKLPAQNNTLTVSQVDVSPDLSRRAIVNVRVRLPYIGQKDWYTRQELTPDKEIVRCRRPGCGRYVLRETWNHEGCYCGAKGNQFFTPDQHEFFQVKDEVIKI